LPIAEGYRRHLSEKRITGRVAGETGLIKKARFFAARGHAICQSAIKAIKPEGCAQPQCPIYRLIRAALNIKMAGRAACPGCGWKTSHNPLKLLARIFSLKKVI
jgi:hypothetical protein